MTQQRESPNSNSLLSQIVTRLELNENADLETINEAITNDIIRINRETLDRFLYNEEAQEIKGIFQLNNNKYRTYKLNKRLHYSYQINKT